MERAAGECPRIVIAGAGAAGSLTALHLTRAATRRGSRIEIVLVDPAEHAGRGVAFGTTDDAHLLNVVASGMSALPEDPMHFLRWLQREYDEHVRATDFIPRRVFGRYLDETMRSAIATSLDLVRVCHRRTSAEAVRRTSKGVQVHLGDGTCVDADAIVVATGLPATGTDWAPESLLNSPFFVADPWAPGALDVIRRDRAGHADVLLVGGGLTAVDIALSLAGPSGRDDLRLHAISRSGELPRVHRADPGLAAIPDIADWADDLAGIEERARRHIDEVRANTGDWRPAVDGLRFRVAELWGRLDEADRCRFVHEHASNWNRGRHRMSPSNALAVEELMARGRLALTPARVIAAEPLAGGGLRVTLDHGEALEVGWVVNCTGPRHDVATLGNSLLDDLLTPRAGTALGRPATLGMGFETDDGRLIDSAGGATAPIWTLGALRRGELWESTAVPEIRVQAAAAATTILDCVAPLPRRLADGRLVSGRHPLARPRDQLGLPISTTSEAATAYNIGLERLMRLQSGAEAKLREAVELDPDFALGHAALAMIGHEAGADVHVGKSLARAQKAARKRGDERERSLVDVVTRRVSDARGTGAQALMNHIAAWPRDVLAVSAAVPTIAFSGVIDVQQEAWDLVDGLGPAYGDHWWYVSLLAFTRQDQERFDEAGLLAESALACEPGSGHAVHAEAHVMYETGQHESGRIWLDHWIAQSGRAASHRAHFSWHSALHDLALGDFERVRQRYYADLSVPTVCGVRSLIDGASLLWRWRVAVSDWDPAVARGLADAAGVAFPGESGPPPVEPILEHLDRALVDAPETPFVAVHAALALAAVGDVSRLAVMRRHCAGHADPVMRTIVVAVADGLAAILDGRWRTAAEILREVMPTLVRVGGSAAQREVVEETLLLALINAGEISEAAAVLDRRISRRTSPLDRRRRASLQTPTPMVPDLIS
jgi:uncharacterized NAD(P)/FAD-binding protein YdhS